MIDLLEMYVQLQLIFVLKTCQHFELHIHLVEVIT